jgi:tetratricopeptide (TPR) repeat protein
LSLLGQHDEAIAEHERARQLDPLSLIVNANLTRALYWARRYDEAIAQARATLELDRGFGVALFWLEAPSGTKASSRKRWRCARRSIANRRTRLSFERSGFTALLRQCGESYRKSNLLETAARCYAQADQKDMAIALL